VRKRCKTVNLPADAAPEQVATVYRRAWELGLKGVTIYRYGSRAGQVLVLGTRASSAERENFARCDPGACECADS
jgi:ribonucleoside-diphosphate reductase alpha chain